MSYEIIEKLKKEIEKFEKEIKFQEIGLVTEAGDGILKISGLDKALSQELLVVETEQKNIFALAFNLEETSIGAIILGEKDLVRVGDRVKKSGKILSLPVSGEIVGRVIDSLGEPIDGKGVVFSEPGKTILMPLERRAPSVMERESVNTPLHTGIKAIDAMIPIGRGQRELIIGDRQTGKTSVAIDVILNQKQDPSSKQVICIYVAIGQKNSKIAKIVKTLEAAGAMKYTVVVSAPASVPASLQYLAPFAGTAIGEFFMERGDDALVVFDDLSKHADAYRSLALLLRRPPGREAYPGDIFYLHSRLLERASKLSKEKKGGSLTALPIIETKLGDVASYIPTNIISITDGQIYLESSLFYHGIRPAVNVGLSVSRVGSQAQTKAMKKVASKLRLELAQFRELKAFSEFSSDLDEATQKRLKRGELLTEILKQEELKPLPFEKEVVLLFAATGGLLDDLRPDALKDFSEKFLEHIEKLYSQKILNKIVSSGAIDEAVGNEIKEATLKFKEIFKK